MMRYLKTEMAAPGTGVLGVSRRTFLRVAALGGGAMLIGVALPNGGQAAVNAAPSQDGGFMPNAFARFAPDGTVTVISKHIEFGQGTFTGLATLFAEELDASWDQIRVEHAPADASRYNNLMWGPYQGTGGSSAMANSYEQMRRAGAVARALFVSAAAREWGVAEDEISVSGGIVSHAGSNRSTGFGALVATAVTLAPPAAETVALKDQKDFKLIGKHGNRVDSRSKITGQAGYTIDVHLDGMLTAVLARPPRFGATLAGFDPSPALAVKGVVAVEPVSRGVAVIARNTWAAIKGRDALSVEWDYSGAENRGTEQIVAEYRTMLDRPGLPAQQQGDAEAGIAGAATVIQQDYEFPYLAHAPMEPMGAVARRTGDLLEVWTGSQLQSVDQFVAASIAGLDPSQVKIHTVYAGGSFGRLATPDADKVSEAVEVAKAIGWTAPVKVQWTREDDIRGGRYRPVYLHRLRAGLDASGAITGWSHRIVGQSIVKGTPFEGGYVQNGVDLTSVEGALHLPYDLSDMAVDLHTTDVTVPVLWWRAVGSTHTAYSTEVFMDQLAAAAGMDPVAFRLAHMGYDRRHRQVLELVAEKAGWANPIGPNRGRGVAVHKSFGSYVAQVAEITLDGKGGFSVDRVVCAVDCGMPINPDVIKAQVEGGVLFGLGAVLRNRIELENGEVVQSNFHDYEPLRMGDTPSIEVHIVDADIAPTGIGEPGLPPVGPAVANAVLAATGKAMTTLPFSRNDLTGA